MSKLEESLNQSIRNPPNEDKMSGLVFKLEGKLRCALTGKLVTEEQSEYARRNGPRIVYCDGRIGVRRFSRFYPIRQDEPCKDRQGHWKQAWTYHVKRNGANIVCHHRQAF